MLLFVLWIGRGSNSSQVSVGTALSKPTQHFPAMDVQRQCARVLRASVPDEMGKYDCFPLGNAFFLFTHQGFILSMSIIMQLCMWKSHIPCSNTEHKGNLRFSDMGHPKLLGCSHAVFPGQPPQENFYLEQ